MASASGSTSTAISSANSLQSENRDVISTRAPAEGRRSAIASGAATLSKTRSHVARCSANRRRAASAAFSTSASSAVAAPSVTARPARAFKSPVRVSAGHQQTPAYSPLKRCAYAMANEVLPTPPMPCTAARPTDACVTGSGLVLHQDGVEPIKLVCAAYEARDGSRASRRMLPKARKSVAWSSCVARTPLCLGCSHRTSIKTLLASWPATF